MVFSPGQQVLDRFTVVERLSASAQADVWLAQDEVKRGEVLLKVLRRGADTTDSGRFEREARMMSMLTHPNVVQLVSFGIVDGNRPVIAMERIDGETITDLMTHEGPLPWPKAVKLMLGALSGLEAMHGRGIVHRNINPDNIVVTPEGVARLINLELATLTVGYHVKLTMTGEVRGVPQYIAPERAIHQKPSDDRTDVYGAAVTLYKMVSGDVPFRAKSIPELIDAFDLPALVPVAPQGRPELPPQLQEAILAALDVDPAERTPTARKFAQALREAKREASSPPDGAPPILREGRRRQTAPRMGAAPPPPRDLDRSDRRRTNPHQRRATTLGDRLRTDPNQRRPAPRPERLRTDPNQRRPMPQPERLRTDPNQRRPMPQPDRLRTDPDAQPPFAAQESRERRMTNTGHRLPTGQDIRWPTGMHTRPGVPTGGGAEPDAPRHTHPYGTPHPSQLPSAADVHQAAGGQRAVIACMTTPPAPPAEPLARWVETQLRGRGMVRQLGERVFVVLVPADDQQYGGRVAETLRNAFQSRFGDAVRVNWALGGPQLFGPDAFEPMSRLMDLVRSLLR